MRRRTVLFLTEIPVVAHGFPAGAPAPDRWLPALTPGTSSQFLAK